MDLRPVTRNDVAPTVHALVSAFATDPLLGFLFAESRDRSADTGEFFRILLEVRVALGMPAFCVTDNGHVLGGVMGYDSSRPTWDDGQVTQWNHLMATVPGLETRLAAYEALADRFMPAQPHYYLGVIGVREGGQGRGVGSALLKAFCDVSASDSASEGVYLETASPASLRLYLRNGFEMRGEGALSRDTQLWCVFQPTSARGANV